MVVIVGSRVISPEQQEEEGVFLLMQLLVIPWTDTEDEERRRSQREGENVDFEVNFFLGFPFGRVSSGTRGSALKDFCS
jgi:hypothetical protein